MTLAKIKIIDPLHAQQIAAGEVIERPANIVKELVENSLDAGATHITVRIEKAGKKSITITDNGCGMNETDAHLCFARHATSKLSSINDLMHMQTFGFRGEALASIASVGVVTLTTKEASNPGLGIQITYEHGVHTKTEHVACLTGTTLTIHDLFETLPVRKTFLKQDETEWNQIQAILFGMALTHLTLHLIIYKDGQCVLNAGTASSLKDRITQLWNHSLASGMTPVHADERGITIDGLTSLPPYMRYGKDLIMFWVNNRLVKNNEITRAITKGYLQSLPAGKYPATFLSITIDPAQVDINIHPRKEEVRFTKPGVITTLIHDAITAALNQAVTKRLSAPSHQTPLMPFTTLAHPFNDILPPPFTHHAFSHKPLTEPFFASTPSDGNALPITTQQPTPAPKPVQETITAPSFRIIGQLFLTYIIIERDDELLFIDQHAAHERILYNQYITTFTGKEGTHLLFPETVTLASPEAVAALQTARTFLADQGIAFEQSGPHHISITSAPPKLQKESLASVLADTAAFILEHETLDYEQLRKQLNEHVQSHLACKMAVKAGDFLDQQAMQELVAQLLITPNRFMCVHGRPTMWPVSKYDLEKRFKRKN